MSAGLLVRYPLFLIVICAAVFAALFLTGSPSPVGATVTSDNTYVDDGYAGNPGDPCTVNSVNYDACYNNIPAGISSTNAGGTVWVDDGTYTGTINFPRSMSLISLDGPGTTTLQANVADTPVVDVNQDDVTVSGFTIFQQDVGPAATPHAGNAALRVVGNVVGPDSVVIENNNYTGCDVDEGILINPAVEGGHLIIRNNTFVASGVCVNHSFNDLIHFHYTDYTLSPPASNISLLGSDVEIEDNTGTGFGRSGVYFHGDIFFSTVTMDNNDFTESSFTINTTYGVYYAESIRAFSNVIDTNSTYDPDYGYYISGNVSNNSSLALGNVTVDPFSSYGFYLSGNVANQSMLSVVDSTFTGDGLADYGFYVSGYPASANSVFLMSNTTIEEFDSYGYYDSSGAYDNSTVMLQDLTITAASGGAGYGIYTYGADNSSTFILDPTMVTGFTEYGFYSDGAEDGSTSIVRDNTFIAHTDGADYCIYYSTSASYGSWAETINNTCTGFGGPNALGFGYGYYDSSGVYYGSTHLIEDNTFTAHADGAYYGAYVYEVTEGSDATFLRNNVTGITGYGIEVSSETDNQSSLLINDNTFDGHSTASSAYGVYDYGTYGNSHTEISGNTITDFDYAGIYHYYTYYDSSLVIDGNDITGPSGGVDNGIYAYDHYYGSDVEITNNTVDRVSDYGLYIDYLIEYDGTGLIDNNTFTSDPVDFMSYGIYIDETVYSDGIAWITNNTVTGFDYAAYYLYEVSYNGQVTFSGNSATAVADGAEYGVYIYVYEGSQVDMSGNNIAGVGGPNATTGYHVYVDSLDYGSRLTIDGDTHTGHADGPDYGMYVSSGIDDGSLLEIKNSTFAGQDVYGLYLDDTDNGSSALIDNNIIAGQGCLAVMPYTCSFGAEGMTDDGIYNYYSPEYGVSVTVTNNVVTGYQDAGYSMDYIYYGGVLTFTDNQFLGNPSGSTYGFYVGSYLVEYGGTAYIQDNTFTNFDYAGFYGYYMEEGGEAWITDNTFTAHSDGAEYGQYWDYIYEGPNLWESGNTWTGFGGPNAGTGYCGYFNYVYDGADVFIDGDTCTAHADGSYYCIYTYEIYNGSNFAFDNGTCTGATDYGLYNDDYVEYGSTLSFSGNTVTGHSSGLYAGIYCCSSYVDYGSTFWANDNVISNITDYGVYFYYSDDGSSSYINGNTITEMTPVAGSAYGIHHEGSEYGGTHEINNNTITVSYNGIYAYGTYYGGDASICGNDINPPPGGVEYGVYVDYPGYDGGYTTICNNTVDGFTYSGIEISSGNYSGEAEIIGNALNADAGGATYGITYDGDLYDGYILNIESNMITGVDGTAGVRVYEADTGSSVTVHNNTMVLDGADYGVLFDGDTTESVADGSRVNITQNDVEGFDVDGIRFDYEIWGSTVLIQNNILDAFGTDNGIIFDGTISFASIVDVLNNCIYDAPTGVYFNNLTTTAQANVNMNDLADTPTAIDADGLTLQVNGENNWYGSAAGPGAVGNSDNTGNVDDDPWLAAAPSCSGATATPTPSASPTASPTPTPTGQTPSPTPSPTPTPGPTGRATRTPNVTPSPTPAPTPTPTPQPIQADEPTLAPAPGRPERTQTP